MSLTLKQSISTAIVLLGIAGVFLLIFSGHAYRQLTYENEQAALSELVGLKMNDLLSELDRRSKEMGSNLQQEAKMRSALKARDTTAITQHLNDQFFQYYITAGILKVARIYVYDKQFNTLAISTEGFLKQDQDVQLCPEIVNIAKPRQGSERVKTISLLCEYKGHGYYSVLVPIGGLVPTGYLTIVTDPAYSMLPAEKDMGNPVLIKHPNGDIAYQSAMWPNHNVLENFLYAEYYLRDYAGREIISMAIVRDITAFRQSLTDNMIMIMILAACLITPTLLVIVLLIRRAFKPLEKLQLASVELSKGKYITIEGSKFPEINTLVNSFNNMSGNISSLVEKLEVENLQRKKVQEQLEENKKQLEIARDQALNATEVKSRFLANMSHEIRTPLTAIIGFSKRLQKKQLDAERRNESIRTIIKNSEHLLHIVNDILDLSKIEAGKLEILESRFSLFQFMHDIKNIVAESIYDKGLEFSIDYQFPVPKEIITDEVRLKQILINLIANAKKFTSKGYVIIHIGYNIQNNTLDFDIEDTGIGLTPEQSKKIFIAFEQADSSTTKKYGGTGLGLSITQQLVQKLGGEIHVESEVAKGSHFKFSIFPGKQQQLELCNEMQEVLTDSTFLENELEYVSVSGNILLVEDTIDNQELIGNYLADMGANVKLAGNGKEAIEMCEITRFDLVLMDMQMPIMGGIEAIEVLRSKNYDGPIVMLTANAFEEDKRRCAIAGCNEFLVKPLNISALCRVVVKYLSKNLDIEDDMLNSPSGSDVMDNDYIISSLLGMNKKYDVLVQNFVKQLPQFLADLKQAKDENSLEKLLSEAHRLKGVGGNYGFEIIYKVCAEMEQELKKKNLSVLDEYLEKLQTIFTNIDKSMDVYLQSSSDSN